MQIDNVNYDNYLNITGTGKEFAGIKAVKNGIINSTVGINIVTDGGYGVVAENGGIVNIGNRTETDVKGIINTNGKVALYAKNGGKITFAGAKEINGDAVAEGEGSSIDLTLGDGVFGGTWTGNAVGHVNVNLAKLAKVWQGRFDSDGTLSISKGGWEGNVLREGVNIVLQSTANWTGTMEKAGNLTLLGRSNWVNSADKATTVKTFTGPNVDGLKGSITSAADLAIEKYSGMAAVYYTHDAANPASIQGGKITIKSADKEAAITLRTDSSGIDLANDAVVKSVMNSLAQKLTYSAYVTGENNLTGYAEIAEGLTAGALSYKVSNITFSKTTGAGSVTDAGITPFNAVITGDSTKDKAFADRGVLTEAGNTSTYSFTQDTIINNSINIEGATPDPTNMQYAVAIYPDAKKDIVLNMNGHDLVIRNNIGLGEMAQSTSAVIYALNSDTSVTVNNPGAIDLSTFSSAYYAGGIAAGDRYTKDTLSCEVTINNDNSWDHAVKIRGVMGMGGVGSGSIFNINWTGMKVFNHGHIDIKGLVDIESYGAWCASAIGSDGYINIGGGRIVSQDYPSLDAYDNGTVNVNASGSGDALTAGSNDVMIEGNLKATGQWAGAGSGGHINVALVNSKSYLAGLADNPAGGTINLFLQNGAIWTNRDGGFRYGSDSSFRDDAVSRVTHFYGGGSEASRGIIVQKQTGDIILDNYTGYTLAYFARDKENATEISGGDIIIKHAAKTGDKNAHITMRTDSSGLDLKNEATVSSVLNTLAGKLFYYGYVDGERNLSGTAEIAEGLTASAFQKQADILFDENSGAGRVTKAPLGQTATLFNQVLTGDANTDFEYKKAGVLQKGNYVFDKTTAIKTSTWISNDYSVQKAAIIAALPHGSTDVKNVVINADRGLKLDGSEGGIGIFNGYGSTLTINGDMEINVADGTGIYQGETLYRDKEKKASLTINGDVKIRMTTTSGTVLDNPLDVSNAAILSDEGDGSSIHINGLVDIETAGTGIAVRCNQYTDSPAVTVKGGRIVAQSNPTMNNHALTAYRGTINVGMEQGENSILTSGTAKTEIEGNIFTTKDWIFNPDAPHVLFPKLFDGTINLALTTGESYWKGVADNAGADKLGTFNLYLKNGALWIHDSQGQTYNQTNTGVLPGAFDGVSHVSSFHGGDSDAGRGIIQQKSNTGIAIDNYSGKTMVIYGHNSQNPAEIMGGGISIKKAAAGSAITLMTDSSGINIEAKETVNKVLNALAGKLTYSNYAAANGAERNLTGKVAIGEGLTAPGILWRVGTIKFAENGGTGNLQEGSVVTPETPKPPIELGQYETMIMSGTKSAMVSSAMLWRAENNDMQKRLGELRLSPLSAGIWANIYGGKSKYDQDNTRYSTSYKAVQIGYDKEVNSGRRLGVAVSHNDGDSDYILGGSGDNTATSLSLYGSWQGDKGHYTDIVLKGGQIKNDFTVYNEMGHKVAGDYKTNGLSVSAEYGRRIEYRNGLYVEPQIELSWGRLQGKDYTATSDVKDAAGNYRTMNISQDGFTSLVGRIGVGVGRITDKSSIYAKAFLAHEFRGDFSSRFIAEEAKSSQISLGGSWGVFQLGGSTKVGQNSYAYANLEKSVGGDIETDWRVDAGMRWSF
ncbi:hypothetical protein SRRS_11230 [Sporomusa rhizae]